MIPKSKDTMRITQGEYEDILICKLTCPQEKNMKLGSKYDLNRQRKSTKLIVLHTSTKSPDKYEAEFVQTANRTISKKLS